jgi:peptidoglycan/xylan/chitin deacetylase (PgdA/CDA1 family)
MRRLTLEHELQPAWLTPDQAIRVATPLEEIPLPDGKPLAYFSDGGRVPAIVENEEVLAFAFHPGDAVSQVLQERYYLGHRPFYTRLPINYHRLCPPGLRAFLRSLYNRSARKDVDTGAFPCWPCDVSVEAVRYACGAAARRAGHHALEPPNLWPNGKRFVIALTHDVDGAEGQNQVPSIASLENRRDLRSAWYLPTHRYRLDHGLLSELKSQGHEIGCHDWNHDNRTSFLAPAAIRRRLEACRRVLERHNVVGYRAPSLMRSPALFAALIEQGFLYDSSMGDSERLTQFANASGCGTIFPFIRTGIIEVPCTQPLENMLLYMGLDPEFLLDIWRKKIAWIRQVGGIAVYTTHADPHFSGNAKMRALYDRLLDELSEETEAWRATPREIAMHWKNLLDHGTASESGGRP